MTPRKRPGPRSGASDTSPISDKSPPARPFPNEALLRSAFAGLLTKMDIVVDTQVLHGRLEKGKDIVFAARGPLGEYIQCACVVKNKPLTGTLGANNSLRTLVQQIETAFDEPFATDTQPQRVQCVYVVSPHEISQDAITSVQQEMINKRGQVRFITGARLFTLFHRFWPDYFRDEALALRSYRTHLDAISGIADAMQQLALSARAPLADANAPLRYVPPRYERRLHEYSLPAVDALLLPQRRLEAGRWSLADSERLASRVNALLALARHIRRWSNPNLRCDLDEAAERVLRAVTDDVQDVIDRITHARAGARRYSFDQPNRAAIKFEAEDVVRLGDLVQPARSVAVAAFRPLYRAIKDLNAEAAGLAEQTVLSVITPEAARTFMLDDILSTAPPGVLSRTRTLSVRFTPTILDATALPVLIVGPPGSGKTSLCRRAAMIDAERLGRDETAPLPVYVPLHTIMPDGKQPLLRSFIRTAGQSGLLPAGAGRRKQRVRVYLDGLDEVASLRTRRTLLARITREQPRDAQLILTARSYLYDPGLQWATRISLAPFSPEDVRDLAMQWLRRKDMVKRFEKELDRTPALAEVVRIPLLATVTLMVFRQTHRLPENRARLYDLFVSLLCGGWDLAKNVNRGSRFAVAQKTGVLESVAWELHDRRRQDLSSADAEAICRMVFKRDHVEPAAILSEIVTDGLLHESQGKYYFPHLSFQEFLSARHALGDLTGATARRILRRYLDEGDDWWRESLLFLVSLAGNPRTVLAWIRDHPASGSSGARATELESEVTRLYPGHDV